MYFLINNMEFKKRKNIQRTLLSFLLILCTFLLLGFTSFEEYRRYSFIRIYIWKFNFLILNIFYRLDLQKHTLSTKGIQNKNHYVKATGFKYCSHLDGSLFDSSIELKPLNGSISSLNITNKEFVQVLDELALSISSVIKGENVVLREEVIN